MTATRTLPEGSFFTVGHPDADGRRFDPEHDAVPVDEKVYLNQPSGAVDAEGRPVLLSWLVSPPGTDEMHVHAVRFGS